LDISFPFVHGVLGGEERRQCGNLWWNWSRHDDSRVSGKAKDTFLCALQSPSDI